MILERHLKEPLKQLVDSIWLVEEKLPEHLRKDVVMPTGQIHMVFNRDKPYFLVKGRELKRMPDQALVGLFNSPRTIYYSQSVNQLGIAFKPSAIYTFFKLHSGLFKDAVIDLSVVDQLFDFNMTIQSLLEGELVGEVLIDAVETYLLEWFETLSLNNPLAQMIDYIEDNQGVINIEAMAQDLHLSVSSIERTMKKGIGLTPKAYANIIKFRFAMADDEPMAVYYDQSHFIKACQRYTENSPSTLKTINAITLTNMLRKKD